MDDYDSILRHLSPAMLVIVRIGGLMIFGPVFGSPMVLARVKVLLAIVLGLSVYPLLSAEHLRGAGVEVDLALWTLAPVVATELMIGLVIGYMASIPLVAVQTGGLVMGQQMGLGFARFFNPAINDEADILGQLLFFLALAGFLVIGGHEAMILAILHSFDRIPLGGFGVDMDLLGLITGMLVSAYELALRVAAPVLALIFLQSVAMGFMAKTVPQLNVLSLGFLIRILVGFSIVMLGLVVIQDVVMDEVVTVLDRMLLWVEVGA